MIGERLAELRKDRGMTQLDLANKLNLSKFTISSYENETTMPNDEIKVHIARIFDVSLDYLLGLIDQPLSYSGKPKNCLFYPENLPKEAREELKTCVDFISFKYLHQINIDNSITTK